MDVISWLGAFHVKNEVYEKAMPYFDLAARIQPTEVKWQLMVASCFRRIGAYPQALATVREAELEMA
jgi:intraflagellar transport protein 88